MSDENAVDTTEGSESSTESKAVEATKAPEKSQGNMVSYDRLKEVIDQRDGLTTKYEALEESFADKNRELGQMIELLQSRDEDSNLIARIRELGTSDDPLAKDLVSKLDLILQGKRDELEEESEVKGETDQTVIDKKAVNKLLDETKEVVAEQAADMAAEMLLMKADSIAEKYFNELPEHYTEKDKEVVGTLLKDTVAWDTIEESPDSLPDELAKGMEKALELFGEPRGSTAKAEEETTETTEAGTSTPPAEELPEYLTKDWGELQEVKLPDGKTTLKPVHSEEDWRDALAAVMREGRGG